MKPTVVAQAVLLVFVGTSIAEATDVPGGDVSGTWSVGESPYVVLGEITVPAGDTLTIGPGVEVRFDGHYALAVEGVLVALGAAGDTVLFTPNIPGETWAHIEIDSLADQGSRLSYCRVEHADATTNDVRHRDGGGISIPGETGVTIDHTTVAQCAARHGGGIFAGRDTAIEDCTIRHCSADYHEGASRGRGGGVCLEVYSTLTRCVVTDNVAEYGGGGVAMHEPRQTMTGCVIARNTVQGDAESYGGGVSCEHGIVSAAGIADNLICDNVVLPPGRGGGLFMSHTFGVPVSGTTIVGNSAPSGAGISVDLSGATFDNCIIAFNDGEATEYTGFQGPYYTCVWSFGNAGGDTLHGTTASCVEENPLFCDATGGDYSLCANSPCAPGGTCGLVGALGVGCGDCDSPVWGSSWGRIKSLYR